MSSTSSRVGAAGGGGSVFFSVFISLTTRKIAKATMMKSRMVLMNTPYFIITAGVASVAAFLASDDASYITGTTIYPDGGRLALNYTVPVAD